MQRRYGGYAFAAVDVTSSHTLDAALQEARGARRGRHRRCDREPHRARPRRADLRPVANVLGTAERAPCLSSRHSVACTACTRGAAFTCPGVLDDRQAPLVAAEPAARLHQLMHGGRRLQRPSRAGAIAHGVVTVNLEIYAQ
jgi:hypothetical protein